MKRSWRRLGLRKCFLFLSMKHCCTESTVPVIGTNDTASVGLDVAKRGWHKQFCTMCRDVEEEDESSTGPQRNDQQCGSRWQRQAEVSFRLKRQARHKRD